MSRTFVYALLFACSATSSKAHEFWIDPVEHQLDPSSPVIANLRVGQEFEGSAYSFIPDNFRRFDYEFNGEVAPVQGTVGDRPAMDVSVEGEGLFVAIHVTTDQHLVWDTWEKFESFLEHKDLTWGLAEHDARGLSHEKVRERYSRYAKSLIAVGSGAGHDIDAGLLVEIVALENPYTDDLSDGLAIRAEYDGAPLTDTQIEIYEKAADGTVVVTTNRTDSEGNATIPVKPGHRYMLDAVVLRPLDVVEEKDPAWDSLWANLTFQTPGS